MGSLPECWRRTVIAALEKLRAGDDRGFEDILWLGLGNAWCPIRDGLVRQGLIEIPAQATHPRLTPRGKRFLERSPSNPSS